MQNKMYVVTHKTLDDIIHLEGYSYIQVNALKNGDLGFEYIDASLDNISGKNDSFCELTALYWMWKNDSSTNIGLSHYRRFFYHSFKSINKFKIYTIKELDNILLKYDIVMVLPSRMAVNGVKNVYEQYKQEHFIKDLDNTRKIISKLYPDYLSSFDHVMNSSEISLRNMFYTKKEILNEYSSWLFSILFELESQTDISQYDKYQYRIYGFLSERLFNVFVHHKKLKIKYLPICFTEDKSFKTYIGKNLRVMQYKLKK